MMYIFVPLHESIAITLLKYIKCLFSCIFIAFASQGMGVPTDPYVIALECISEPGRGAMGLNIPLYNIIIIRIASLILVILGIN